MKPITVDKQQLATTLQHNLAEHTAAYDKAMETYQVRVRGWFEENLALMIAGDYAKVQHRCPYPVPEEHSEDYQRVLDMLTWDLGDTYELSETDFEQYIDNQWGWARSFAANTSSYLVTEGDQ